MTTEQIETLWKMKMRLDSIPREIAVVSSDDEFNSHQAILRNLTPDQIEDCRKLALANLEGQKLLIEKELESV